MKKKLFLAVTVAAAIDPLAAAQVPGRTVDVAPDVPAFEVVSVKKNGSNAAGYRMQVRPGGRVMITNAPPRVLIEMAYGLLPQQLAGGPAWIDAERFDIVAQAKENLPPSPPGGPPGPAQLMLQRLLAERFRLVVHDDKRELQIFALTVQRDDGRLGPSISAANQDCAALMAAYGRGEVPLPPESECSITGAPGRVSARGASMAMFARAVLAIAVERIVEDRTGLTGGFNFDLQFAADPGSASGTSDSAGASIFTALEEQLGLKLRPVRAPVDVLVIDRIERPTED